MTAATAERFRLGVAIAVGAAVINGMWPAVLQGAYADGMNVATYLLVVAGVRAVFFLGFCLVTRRRLFATRRDLQQGVVGGFFRALPNACLGVALLYIPGPIAIVILFSHSLMLLFFMAWRGEMRLTAATIVATLLALTGLTFVLDVWHVHSTGSWLGMGMAFIAALATVLQLYTIGKQVRTTHPMIAGAETFVFVPLFLLPVLFVQTPHWPASEQGWIYLLLLCLTTTAGITLIFYGIALLGPFRWSLFAKLEPVCTALFAFLLLGQTLKTYQYAGMGVVLASLAAYQIMDNRAKLRAAAAGGMVAS